MASFQPPGKQQLFAPGSGTGLALIFLGFFAFFGSVLLPIFYSGDGTSFVLSFFVCFFLSFGLMAAGGLLFAQAQTRAGEQEQQQKAYHLSQEYIQEHVKQLASQTPQPPPPPPAPVIIQNIGQYVAGSKVDIKDSVVMRSKLGEGGARTAASVEASDVLEEYRRVLRDVWKDGSISPEEFEFLEKVRNARNITLEQHREVEKEVFFEINSLISASEQTLAEN